MRRTSLSSSAENGFAGMPAWVWLLGPYLIVLAGMLFLPLAYLATISVFTHDPNAFWKPILTDINYRRLLDPYYASVLFRTLRIGLVTTLVCAVLGFPLAYWLARCSPRVVAGALFLVVMPMMVSTVIRSFGWMVLLGRNGVINAVSDAIGLGPWLSVMNTETAVVIALVHICLPLMVLPTMAAIEKIPVNLEEAAANLGAGAMPLLRRVLIPLAAPGLVSGALLVFVVAISVVVTPALMGGRANRMLGNEIYDLVMTALNWPFAAAMAIVLIVLVLVFLALSLWVGNTLSRRMVRS
jgi:putative spermidine/putrescine transport system permease protein